MDRSWIRFLKEYWLNILFYMFFVLWFFLIISKGCDREERLERTDQNIKRVLEILERKEK